jgi:hypothetical protein
MKFSHLLPMIALCAAASLALAESKAASERKTDSLEVLQNIIRGEMKPKNRVLILKNSALSDSLLRLGSPVRRDELNRIIGDSSLVHEIKTSADFQRYWSKVEKQNGITALKNRYESVDIDKSPVPHAYLFDSSVVVYPGVIILRKK